MAEYRETTRTIEERTWRRMNRLSIEAPAADERYLKFGEEDVVRINGTTKTRDAGSFSASPRITDAFALLDPQGQPTGQTMTMRQLNAIHQSLYIHFATLRDAA